MISFLPLYQQSLHQGLALSHSQILTAPAIYLSFPVSSLNISYLVHNPNCQYEAYHQRRSGVCFGIHCQLHHQSASPPHSTLPLLTCITDRIKTFKPTAERPFVLGLPTGSSPVVIYRILVQKYKAGEISFENVITFNMVCFSYRCKDTILI